MRRFGIAVFSIFAVIGFLSSAEIFYVMVSHRIATKCVDDDDTDMTHFAIPTRQITRN